MRNVIPVQSVTVLGPTGPETYRICANEYYAFAWPEPRPYETSMPICIQDVKYLFRPRNVWSIASKTMATQLIADGIMGRAISRKARPNGHDLLCVVKAGDEVYIKAQRGDELTDEPLWIPSFIDVEIWQQAVSRFHGFTRLDRNVEKYLLPKMDEYLQNIPDTDLISMTRDFLIAHGVINKPISQRRGKTYYFNESEVYVLDEEAIFFPCEKRRRFDRFEVMGETCFNMNVWHKAVSQFEIGTTLKECIEIFLKTELVHSAPQELSSIDRLIQYISPPIYERVPENKDETTGRTRRTKIIFSLTKMPPVWCGIFTAAALTGPVPSISRRN